jgi:hypothetical protein
MKAYNMDKLIQLDTHYTRSINLERDADSSDILNAYIPTTRAIQTLDNNNDFLLGRLSWYDFFSVYWFWFLCH